MADLAVERLNYHHLYLFWVAAREESISRACRRLLLAQPTVSAQLHALQKALGQTLFRRSGRGIVLTETGRLVQRYADEIFSLGRELEESLRRGPTPEPLRLLIGVSDDLPKLLAYRLLEPVLRLPEPVQLVCREGRVDRLLAELALNELDLVLADAPAPAEARVRVFSHWLGESTVSVMADPSTARRLRRGFPGSLDGAAAVLPSGSSAMRRSLDLWFERQKVRPRVRAEIDDSGLLKAFGEGGVGVVFQPTVIEAQIRRQHGLSRIARLDDVKPQFYAISIERRLLHPAVVAITDAARRRLFGGDELEKP